MPLAASYVRLLISKADFAKAGATAPIGQAATPPKPRRRGGLVAHCCGICDGSSMRAIRSADFTARAVFLAVENRGAALAIEERGSIGNFHLTEVDWEYGRQQEKRRRSEPRALLPAILTSVFVRDNILLRSVFLILQVCDASTAGPGSHTFPSARTATARPSAINS